MPVTADLTRIWFWPWEAARLASHIIETAAATQSVLARRLPLLADAAINPLTADYRELSLMLPEKVDAFGRSQKSIGGVGATMRKTAEANARDFGRMVSGTWLQPNDWVRMFERNVALGSALVTLPMQALAPVHKGVTSNARRLGS